MPELPDVEGFRRTLDSCGRGRQIKKVEVADAGVLRGVSAPRFARALEGRRFVAVERRGKWLIARVEGGAVVLLHFGMTGQLLCSPSTDPPHRHDRVRVLLDGGLELRYRDQRKLQGLRLATSQAAAERALAGQGPDALAVGREYFRGELGVRRAKVKAVLMDQSALAGLGNLLADEILWRAHLHPATAANQLSGRDVDRLYSTMRQVLHLSVRAQRVPARRSWLTGHREAKTLQCPRCGSSLLRGKFAGRTSVWCPYCQPER
ncbi:DNA-formamidopyrimidine glycosylase family protein [Streptomyces sp. NPDC008139]|uniref:Fpg/Nei family DNA glycosylase n=1 Tax=Streptomyces sp. NPDC008139 TaxID=3364814 RepID=UPI0036E7808D